MTESSQPATPINCYLCTDLDRTLIPNGSQPESEAARPLFRHLVARKDVHLTYITGRDKGRVLEAIDEWNLPVPDHVIADVGSCIYRTDCDGWQAVPAWQRRLDADWHEWDIHRIAAAIEPLPHTRRQSEDRLGPHKLSYDVHPSVHLESVAEDVRQRCRQHAIPTMIITSIDETTDTGLIDLLPPSASKRGALDWLARTEDWPADKILFSGDSGNDWDLLISPYQTVLVANADQNLRASLRSEAARLNLSSHLYCATGMDWPNGERLNGNYAAGILEGLQTFFPALMADLKETTHG